MGLVTMEGLEIIQAGVEYPLSTGTASFTMEDLADAVKAANEDPAVKAPRLKLGHTSTLNASLELDDDDGQPALGTVQNMRLNDKGNVILGDYVGVPSWLAAVMPSAYPSRSFEGSYNYKTATGRSYRMVVKAVALLGVRWPGCSTIDDIESLYGDGMPEGVTLEASEGGVSLSFDLAAAVNVDDIRRQFYDGPAKENDDFLWVQAVYVDPYTIIVMNEDENQLERYSFECSPEGEVTFGDPEPVIVQYVPDPLAASEGRNMALVSNRGRQIAVYASRSESRPDNKPQGGQKMDPAEFRSALGLPAEATDDEVRAKLAELQGDPSTKKKDDDPEPEAEEKQPETKGEAEKQPESEPEPVTASDGTVTVPAEVWAQIQAGAQRGNQVFEETRRQERDEAIHKACEKGKIAASQREQFTKLWDKDPEGTKRLLTASVDDGGLADNLVPVKARGSNDTGEDADIAATQSYDPTWLSPGERQRIEAAAAGRS